uniref:Adenylate/guanylate cyclase domain-containing protein n=1 Tax=Thermocrispum agreste TaxID=37925 RepID=A0A2W4JRD0_9PSEU|nr:MAG: adenylate/guanylate cyclase domain-containing protein [Thermocrispum agreste]
MVGATTLRHPSGGSVDDPGAGTAPLSARTRRRIDELLLGGPRKYNRLQVAELSGVPADVTQRRWRSLGFATAGDEEVLFTDNDVAAAALAEKLLATGVVPAGMDVAVTRAVGHHLSRLAEWQIELVRELLDKNPELLADEDRLVMFLDTVMPLLEQLQTFVWRRHLAAYAARAFDAGEDDTGALAVGFADMVGYTRLTRRIDEEQLSEVLDKFEALASAVVAERHGRIVKTIGDEVMFVADTPADAVEIAAEFARRAAEDDDIPDVRVGVAFGPVLSRLGDVFGKTVNIAARLTSTARPGTIVVDEGLAEALGEHAPYQVRPLRPVSVRGYSRLKRFAVKVPTQ